MCDVVLRGGRCPDLSDLSLRQAATRFVFLVSTLSFAFFLFAPLPLALHCQRCHWPNAFRGWVSVAAFWFFVHKYTTLVCPPASSDSDTRLNVVVVCSVEWMAATDRLKWSFDGACVCVWGLSAAFRWQAPGAQPNAIQHTSSVIALFCFTLWCTLAACFRGELLCRVNKKTCGVRKLSEYKRFVGKFFFLGDN